MTKTVQGKKPVRGLDELLADFKKPRQKKNSSTSKKTIASRSDKTQTVSSTKFEETPNAKTLVVKAEETSDAKTPGVKAEETSEAKTPGVKAEETSETKFAKSASEETVLVLESKDNLVEESDLDFKEEDELKRIKKLIDDSFISNLQKKELKLLIDRKICEQAEEAAKGIDKSNYIQVTKNQFQIYQWLLENVGNRYYCIPPISEATGIVPVSVRAAIKKLLEKNILIHPSKYNYKIRRQEYYLNKNITVGYTGFVNNKPEKVNSKTEQINFQDNEFFEKSREDIVEIAKNIIEKPGFEIWKATDLNPSALATIMIDQKITPYRMLRFLDIAMFSYESQNGVDAQGDKINLPAWFIGTIKKYGSFNEPKGFIPLYKRLLKEEKDLEAEYYKDLEELRRKRENNEIALVKIEYENFLLNNDSDEYRKFIEDNPGFSNYQASMPRSMERARYLAFKKMRGYDISSPAQRYDNMNKN